MGDEFPDFVCALEGQSATEAIDAGARMTDGLERLPAVVLPPEAVFDLQSNGYLIVRDGEVVAWEPRPADQPPERSAG